DFGRALARREHDGRAGQPRWRRWRWRRGRRGRSLTELGGPRDPRGSEAHADRAVRCRHRQPSGLVPAVDDVQVREDLVEVPGPAVRADAGVEGIAPDLVELVLNAPGGGTLRHEVVDRPSGRVDDVPAVIPEGRREDLAGFR